jgi:hypothetical protein
VTQHPFGHDELDRVDPGLDAVAHELERYAAGRSDDAPAGLAAAIREAIAAEPEPSVGWWQRFIAGPAAWGATGRAVAVAGVLVLALVGSLAVGQLLNVAGPNVGTSPDPSPSVVPSERPSPSVTPSPSPSPTDTAERSPSATPSTPSATPSDDHGGDDETPEPTDDDNSGPGGGGDDDETPRPTDDNSGPGGGGDD